MVQQTLFIADLHLSDSQPEITRCFINYIQSIDAAHTDALYILGDLFEVWIGDDNQTPLNKQIAAALKALSQHLDIYFIHGNRDFLVRKKFAQQAGMTLLPEQHVIQLYGQSAVILHGDELCTLDVDYQKFRKKSRGWWWPRMILSLPLSVRRKIAENGRKASKDKQAYLSQEIMDVTQSEVEKCLQHHAVRLMIHGHTHRPAIHDFSAQDADCRRIVLGDWYEQGSVLVVTPDGAQLQQLPFASTGSSG